MLQQTQVNTVIPYYDRFLKRFPDLRSLAKASEHEVLKLWSGLGYYSRARNLHRAARQILEKHKEFPKEYKDILILPGIGHYTAGAICSIGFNQARPVVDGNIRRVITRLNGIVRRVPEIFFWDQMSAWLPKNQSSAFNQAMMELGALVCVPLQPHCPLCPVEDLCEARRLNIQNRIPVARTKPAARHIQIAVLILEQKGKILLTSSHKLSFIPGRWALPCRQILERESPEHAGSELCRAVAGSTIRLAPCARIDHSISNRRITVYGFSGRLDFSAPRMQENDSSRWTRFAQCSEMLTSSLFRKVLQNWGELSAKEN
jgi:A/G-specific adenine glycosylase